MGLPKEKDQVVRMGVHHLVLLQIILLVWPIKGSGAYSCPYRCGDVIIRYPFGIGEQCYFDKGFEVSCDYSSSSPKPFLTSINLVLEDTEYGSSSFQVNFPVISLNNKTIVSEDFNLSGTHFSFPNTLNTFIAVGCDSYYEQSKSTLATCQSFCHCDPTKARGCCDFICTVPRNYTFDSIATISKVYSASIPQEMECKSAFMVDREWFQSNYQITNSSVLKGKEHSPAALEWGRYKGSCVELYNSDTTCDLDGDCIIKLEAGYICDCDPSISYSHKGCSGDLICNFTGGYDCSGCPHGYKKDGSRCSKIEDIFIKKSRTRFCYHRLFYWAWNLVARHWSMVVVQVHKKEKSNQVEA